MVRLEATYALTTMNLLCLISLLSLFLFTGCQSIDAYIDTGGRIAGDVAMIGIKGAALYVDAPEGQSPDRVLPYGEKINILRSGREFSYIKSVTQGSGFVRSSELTEYRR